MCGFIFISTLSIASAIRIIPETQRLSIFRLGRYIGEVGPGVVILIPFIDRGVKKDVKDQVKQFQDNQRIWGDIGNTLTTVHTEGDVEISGEFWNATSKDPIPAGERVRINQESHS